MSSIQRACDAVGSPSKLAQAIGVNRQFVHQWLHGARPVPPARCISIEKATGGTVTRYELRPDVFGDPDAELHRGVVA